MTQGELAVAAGIAQPSLSNYELGKRDVPLFALLRIAQSLEIPLGELVPTEEVIVVRDSALGREVESMHQPRRGAP